MIRVDIQIPRDLNILMLKSEIQNRAHDLVPPFGLIFGIDFLFFALIFIHRVSFYLNWVFYFRFIIWFEGFWMMNLYWQLIILSLYIWYIVSCVLSWVYNWIWEVVRTGNATQILEQLEWSYCTFGNLFYFSNTQVTQF